MGRFAFVTQGLTVLLNGTANNLSIMNSVKLRQAFSKSDFDCDGYLNEFETNHFGYLLFGHKDHGALYPEMCSYCDSNPMFGLNFDNILSLFPVIECIAESTNEESIKQKKKKK